MEYVRKKKITKVSSQPSRNNNEDIKVERDSKSSKMTIEYKNDVYLTELAESHLNQTAMVQIDDLTKYFEEIFINENNFTKQEKSSFENSSSVISFWRRTSSCDKFIQTD